MFPSPSFHITILLFLIPSWSEASGGILIQLGLVFIIFALFLIGRDLWFLHSNRIFRNTLSIIVAESVFISLSALIFIYVRPYFYNISGAFAGRAVFIIWALIIMILTPYTFFNRKQFLA